MSDEWVLSPNRLRPTPRWPRRHITPIRARISRRLTVRRLATLAIAALLTGAVSRMGPPGDARPSPQPDVVIVEADTATAGSHGLKSNERAVAVARPRAPLPLEPGDHVELISVVAGSDGSIRSEILGSPARVLELNGESVVVAVPTDMARVVVERQAGGVIELVLTP